MSHFPPFQEYTYYLFDDFSSPADSYRRRIDRLIERFSLEEFNGFRVRLHDCRRVESLAELLAYEEECLELGYEGLILRSLHGRYKFNRTTLREDIAFKLKRFQDSEAEIIGLEEEMENTNEAETNELGRTKRSTAKAGLVGKGTLGAFLVRDLVTGVEFRIGSGALLTKEGRAKYYNEKYIGKIVTYKFFPVGVKDKPRHPIVKGFRDLSDM
jgi:DNA ligase-1